MNMSYSLCWKHFIVTTHQVMIFHIMISPVAVNPQIKLLLVSVVLFNNYWKWRNDRRSERNLCNCVKKPEKKKKKKNSGLQRGLNPWSRDYGCDALPTELWSHWRWEPVNCGLDCWMRLSIIWRIMEFDEGVEVKADNTLLDLHNSSDDMKAKFNNNWFIIHSK